MLKHIIADRCGLYLNQKQTANTGKTSFFLQVCQIPLSGCIGYGIQAYRSGHVNESACLMINLQMNGMDCRVSLLKKHSRKCCSQETHVSRHQPERRVVHYVFVRYRSEQLCVKSTAMSG